MAIKIFLDTNIILDVLDTDRIFSKESSTILNYIEAGELKGYFSESVITTTDYVLLKKYSLLRRSSMITNLLKLITIIECTNSIVESAVFKNENDIEDSILYELAYSEKLDYLITNDKQALKKLASKKLPIMTSKEFLKIV